jgi:hypothetical protein
MMAGFCAALPGETGAVGAVVEQVVPGEAFWFIRRTEILGKRAGVFFDDDLQC